MSRGEDLDRRFVIIELAFHENRRIRFEQLLRFGIGVGKDQNLDNAFPVFELDDRHRIAFLGAHQPQRGNEPADRDVESGRFFRQNRRSSHCRRSSLRRHISASGWPVM